MLKNSTNLAIWPFRWLIALRGALPPSSSSKESFQNVYAWVDRFSKAVSTAKSAAPKPTAYKGAEAVKYIVSAEYHESEGDVDASDPPGLEKGQDESWPIDSGSRYHDRGKLVSLTSEEVVLASGSKVGGKEVRLHCPRCNYRITPVNAGGANL